MISITVDRPGRSKRISWEAERLSLQLASQSPGPRLLQPDDVLGTVWSGPLGADEIRDDLNPKTQIR